LEVFLGEDHEIGGGGAVGVDVDLLGLPLLPLKDPRGRPAFAKTQENQMVVMTLRAKGQSVGEIATFLRCDEKTVRKHFSRELDAGASLLEGIAMQVLVRKMLEGSVGATRQVLEICASRASDQKVKRAQKAPEPGKREQAQLEAAKAPPSVADLLGRTERLTERPN
jgi:hypothetical protein